MVVEVAARHTDAARGAQRDVSCSERAWSSSPRRKARRAAAPCAGHIAAAICPVSGRASPVHCSPSGGYAMRLRHPGEYSCVLSDLVPGTCHAPVVSGAALSPRRQPHPVSAGRRAGRRFGLVRQHRSSRSLPQESAIAGGAPI